MIAYLIDKDKNSANRTKLCHFNRCYDNIKSVFKCFLKIFHHFMLSWAKFNLMCEFFFKQVG